MINLQKQNINQSTFSLFLFVFNFLLNAILDFW